MSHQSTTLNQILQFISRHDFENCVKEFKGDFCSKGFTCWEQFTAMLYAQLSSQKGLRGIESGLKVNQNSLYHLGVKSVKRTTLAYANENRSYKIYEKLFYLLLHKLDMGKTKNKLRIKNSISSVDASTIHLCKNLFPWAEYKSKQRGIKLHVKFDHSTSAPSFISVTNAQVHEKNEIGKMPFEKDEVIAFDRGYLDYKQYSKYCKEGIYFVTRTKKNARFTIIEERDVSRIGNIIFDKTTEMSGFYPKKNCPERLRLIRSYDPETGKTIDILTNQFSWSPKTIAAIYKKRWEIEIFFKTIKQNLKIKSFFGTSRNAVLTQIWICMIAFLLLKHLSALSQAIWSVGEIMSILPILLFQRKDIWLWLKMKNIRPPDPAESLFQPELGL